MGEKKVKTYKDQNMQVISECQNPCMDNYIFFNNVCIIQDDVDMETLDECHALHQGRKLQGENGNEEDLSLAFIVTDSAGLLVGLVVGIFALALLWGHFLQTYPVPVVWITIGLEIVISVICTIWLADKSSDAGATMGIFVFLGLGLLYKTRKKVTVSANLLGASCRALRDNVAVFGYCMVIKIIWLGYIAFTFFSIHESFMIRKIEINETLGLGFYDDSYSVCETNQPSWVHSAFPISFILLGWITMVFDQIRFAIVSGTVSMWYVIKTKGK